MNRAATALGEADLAALRLVVGSFVTLQAVQRALSASVDAVFVYLVESWERAVLVFAHVPQPEPELAGAQLALA